MRQPRPMRRKNRALDLKEAMAILDSGRHGILATADPDGLPLATPLSYVLMDGALYFHGAKAGHKMDNLAAQSQVSFCVVTQDDPHYGGGHNFTVKYKSVVVNGTATLVDEPAERDAVLLALCEKYLPGHTQMAEEYVSVSGAGTAVVRISLDDVQGKSNAGP